MKRTILQAAELPRSKDEKKRDKNQTNKEKHNQNFQR